MNKMRVDYRTALEPAQAKEMGRFLHSLLWAAEKAQDAGVKPNVDIFMRSWIGMPITAEGKKQRKRQQHAGWRKRRCAVGGKV